MRRIHDLRIKSSREGVMLNDIVPGSLIGFSQADQQSSPRDCKGFVRVGPVHGGRQHNDGPVVAGKHAMRTDVSLREQGRLGATGQK